jgi:YggT family protein
MQWAQWEYHNPLVQFIIRATQFPVKYLRKAIPPFGKWDSATFVLLFLLALLKISLVGLFHPISPSATTFIGLVFAEVFSLFITLFTASIIIQVILCWVTPPGSYNPIAPLIARMNRPLLAPIQQLIPPLGGIDLSPLVAILGLQILSMLVLPLLTGHI